MRTDAIARSARRVITCVLLFSCAAVHAEVVWYWEDRFSSAEKDKLTAWIDTVVDSVEEAVAPFPFDLHIRFHRTRAYDSPVPWANTIRSRRRQGVNVHVDPDFSRSELLADWTAYHELAHLFLPFLGRDNSWFAEGYASFMQYQLMHAAGVLTREAMWATYRAKIERAARRYDMPERNFIEAAPTLRARRDYPTEYWGGAVYFLRVDSALRAHGSSVPEVVSEYVKCCRDQNPTLDPTLDHLVESLDRIAGQDLFRRELERLRRSRGFPDFSGVLR